MRIFRTFCVALAWALALSVTSVARADSVDDAHHLFTTDRFDDTVKAVETLAQTGHASAEPTLAALSGNRLLVHPVDKGVFYRATGVPA